MEPGERKAPPKSIPRMEMFFHEFVAVPKQEGSKAEADKEEKKPTAAGVDAGAREKRNSPVAVVVGHRKEREEKAEAPTKSIKVDTRHQRDCQKAESSRQQYDRKPYKKDAGRLHSRESMPVEKSPREDVIRNPNRQRKHQQSGSQPPKQTQPELSWRQGNRTQSTSEQTVVWRQPSRQKQLTSVESPQPRNQVQSYSEQSCRQPNLRQPYSDKSSRPGNSTMPSSEQSWRHPSAQTQSPSEPSEEFCRLNLKQGREEAEQNDTWRDHPNEVKQMQSLLSHPKKDNPYVLTWLNSLENVTGMMEQEEVDDILQDMAITMVPCDEAVAGLHEVIQNASALLATESKGASKTPLKQTVNEELEQAIADFKGMGQSGTKQAENTEIHHNDQPKSATEPVVYPEFTEEELHEIFKKSALAQQIDPQVMAQIQLSGVASKESRDPYEKLDLGKLGNLFQQLCLNNNPPTQPASSIDAQPRDLFTYVPFESQFTFFRECQRMTPAQTTVRWQLAVDLFFILGEKYSQCDLQVFGSFLTGLGDKKAGLDIHVNLTGDKMGESGQQKMAQEMAEYLKQVRSRHNKGDIIFSKSQPEAGIRGPVVMLEHGKTGITVILHFGHLVQVYNDELLKFYAEYDPRVKPFLELLRFWADFYGVIEPQRKLDHYALNLLAVVYLVQKKIVPALYRLQILAAGERNWLGLTNNPEEVEGWDTSFCRDREKIEYIFEAEPLPLEYPSKIAKTVVEMLQEFCKMHQNLDYWNTFISPLYGKWFVPRKELLQMESANEVSACLAKLEMAKLKNWRLELGSVENMRDQIGPDFFSKPLAIQDLMDMNFNAGGGAESEANLDKFKLVCGKTAELIEVGIGSLLDLFVQWDWN